MEEVDGSSHGNLHLVALEALIFFTRVSIYLLPAWKLQCTSPHTPRDTQLSSTAVPLTYTCSLGFLPERQLIWKYST